MVGLHPSRLVVNQYRIHFCTCLNHWYGTSVTPDCTHLRPLPWTRRRIRLRLSGGRFPFVEFESVYYLPVIDLDRLCPSNETREDSTQVAIL